MKAGVIMILRIMLKDERFKKGYRQVTKEFKAYSDLNNYLQFNKDRIYGQVKKYTILDKGKIKVGVIND
jgi:hypothetical protein